MDRMDSTNTPVEPSEIRVRQVPREVKLRLSFTAKAIGQSEGEYVIAMLDQYLPKYKTEEPA
jgi:hypothetical protein